ncbi:MAG: COG4280 domain-containing protein [Dehalococcoidia bacterium]
MSVKLLLLFLSVFLASIVEFVEALTIVLAVGVTRQWRSTLLGVAAATVALALTVAVFGAAIVAFVPLDGLRLFVGSFLLVFGLQWVRKAVLRAAGRKALHDEDLIFARQREEAARAGIVQQGTDWYAFTVAFKGVFLEGTEVAFIVVTFGSNAKNIPLATLGALAAGLIVIGAGIALHRPLSAVPENTMKFGVGLMLTTFGAFWAGEGLGINWPGSDFAILFLLAGFLALSWLAVQACRPREQAVDSGQLAVGSRQ